MEAATKPKRRANDIVRYAVKRGQIVKDPCEVCGDTEVQAHHDDYERPLEVRWLCARHHGLKHRGPRA